ncbi:nuclear transport factor 2 family protein [Ferruginibacter sp. SUN106]|uniref:nuclear transport factor 2 family protein n=1 Tax=Ferruginibacter sp. SUN106 TaxID=2978348 RepID=UPI003D362996
MIKKIIFILLIFCSQYSFGQTQADTLQIQQTALNYIEGFYNSDGQRMAKAIHPELVKRIIVTGDNGDVMLKTIGASELIFSTKKHTNAVDETKVPFTATVTILDISTNIATIKITTNKFQFFDYAHLGKTGGEWKIINVLWAKKEN